MRKTSVYLPATLKSALAHAAARSGRSEAEFIRQALEAAVRHAVQPATVREPGAPRLSGPLLVGVGVGPGAADLLTPRAREVILQAGAVLAAAISTEAISRAEATVRAAVGPVRVVRVQVDVTGTPERRRASSMALAERIVAHLDRKEVVAFLTIGDPSVFSAFPELAADVRQLRPAVPIQRVPGVMAFQELAARSGAVVGSEHASVRMVAVRGDVDEPSARIAETLARSDETLVVYRGGRCVAAIADRLRAAGRDEQAVVGELLGLPGERCAPASEYVDAPASYLATLIAPATRDA